MNTNINATFALSPSIPSTSPILSKINGVSCTLTFTPTPPSGGSLSASLQTPVPFGGGGYSTVLPAVVAYQAQQTSSAPAAAGPRFLFPDPANLLQQKLFKAEEKEQIKLPDAANLWEQTPASIIGPVGLSGGQAAYDASMLNCNVTISLSSDISPPFAQYGGSVAASFMMPFATSSVDIVATDWTWQSGHNYGVVTSVTLSVKIDGVEQTIVAK